MTNYSLQEDTPIWKYSSCAVQGKSHIKKNTPCQDKTLTSYSNGVYAICLSDGAGSAKLSHLGADCVVNRVCELLTVDFDSLYAKEDGRDVKIIIVDSILEAVRKEAENLCCDHMDLAATMLAVAVKDNRFIIAHIGDGVIGCLNGLELKVVSAPSNGEHANETYFVTSSRAINTMKLFKGNIENISGFVIMSDGTEHSLYNKRNNTLSNAVIKLLQRNVLLSEQAMNSQLDVTFKNVIATRTNDDCSIAILSRRSDVLRPLGKLSTEEKCEVLGISKKDNNMLKRIKRYEKILDLLQTSQTCSSVARSIQLKPKYTQRHLETLRSAGLIKMDNGCYKAIN